MVHNSGCRAILTAAPSANEWTKIPTKVWNPSRRHMGRSAPGVRNSILRVGLRI
jgi:hypothetical protein